MSPDSNLVDEVKSKPESIQEAASAEEQPFDVYERDLLLHLWRSPLVAEASQDLPPKLKDWYRELLSDGSVPNHPSPAHPRHTHRRQPRNEEDNARGLQPMGDFRAEGVRPRRHAAHEDSRTAARNERRQQQSQHHQQQQPPPALRSDSNSWRPSRLQAPTPNTRHNLGGGHNQEDLPAWMDDDGPSDNNTPSWFNAPSSRDSKNLGVSAPDPGGHIDSIQAFKAQMRAEEQRKLRRDNDLPSDPSTPLESSNPINDRTESNNPSAAQSPAPRPDSRATPSALDALFTSAQTPPPPSESKPASAASTAPRSSRFAKMFKSDSNDSPPLAKSQQPTSDAEVAGFMSSLLNKAQQGGNDSEGGGGGGGGGGGQSGPAPAPLNAPRPIPTERQQSQPQPQDGDMQRVMQMLQFSVGLSKSPVNGMPRPPSQGASAAPAATPRLSPALPLDYANKPQSRRDFAKFTSPPPQHQQQPSPVNGRAPPLPQQSQPDVFQTLFGAGSPDASMSRPPPQSLHSFQDTSMPPHSVAGLVNLSGSPAGPGGGATTATNAPRFAQQQQPSPPRSEPPRMMQSSPDVHIPPGYAMPRTQRFPPQVMNQPPPPPRSMYDLQAGGMMGPGLPGAGGMPMHYGAPPPLNMMQHRGPPPPSLHQHQGGYPQHQSQLNQGMPGGSALSPDLMALFANAGGQVPQYR